MWWSKVSLWWKDFCHKRKSYYPYDSTVEKNRFLDWALMSMLKACGGYNIDIARKTIHGSGIVIPYLTSLDIGMRRKHDLVYISWETFSSSFIKWREAADCNYSSDSLEWYAINHVAESIVKLSKGKITYNQKGGRIPLESSNHINLRKS